MAPKLAGEEPTNFRDAFQARASARPIHALIRKTPPLSSPWPTILLIALAGVLGFVGLLVCSAYFPAIANPLRIAALAWFFGFGLIQRTFIRRQR